MSFDVANIWQKIDNSKSSSGKFRQKVVFFDEGNETWTSWCRGFVCEFDLATTSSHIFDIRPSIRPTLRKGLMAVKALWP